MEIIVERTERVAVVRVAGSLDAMTAESLSQALTSEISAGFVLLVADLGELHYASSAGLRVILGALKEARGSGGDFRLAGAQGNVHKIMEMSGFTSILKFFDDVEGALASYA